MAKNTGIRKTIEILLKKVEALEDQSFAQKLLIDELENKLQRAEQTIKQVQENPFNLPIVTTPFVQPLPPLITPALPQPHYQPGNHGCIPGQPDWSGGTYCTICGAHISGPTWTITSTSCDSTTLCLADPASQSSTDVEPILDLDISWVIPDEPTK